MPVFEFQCETCGARFQVLVGMVAGPDDSRCPRCGGEKTTRRISRFRVGRGEDARLEEAVDRLETMSDPESGTQLREAMREMGRALDDDAADEMEELFESEIAADEDGSSSNSNESDLQS